MVLAFRAPTGGDASTSADAEEYLSHADANSVLSLDGEVAKTTKNYDFPSLFDAFMSYSELGEFVHMFAWASSALVPVGIVDRDLAKTKSPREETEQSSLKKKTLADERSKPPSLDKTGLWWINGKEYDLTKWVDKHPGGRYLLEITKGTDCTELYESYHAPSLKQDYIRNTLEKYATRSTIAKPTATDQSNAKANTNEKNEEIDNHKHTTTYDWVNTPVYNDLKEVVREYNSKHGIKATDNWAVVVVWYGLWAVLHYTTLYNWLFPQSLLALGSSYAYLNAVLLGCTIWCFSTDMMHAGTHYQLCRNAVHSEWLGWLCGWMFCLPQTWIRQHVAGHHIHTNVLEKDPDLYHYQDVMNVHPDETRVPSSPWLFAIAPFTTQWVPSFFYTLPLLANVSLTVTLRVYYSILSASNFMCNVECCIRQL